MFQIIFNDISAAEMAQIPKLLQLDILSEFDQLPSDFDQIVDEKFGIIQRDGKKLYRFRAKEYRIYFEPTKDGVMIHRVFHKNTLNDFLFRAKLPVTEEDLELQNNPKFWEMINEPTAGKT
ncbi:MAG: hypothetical protein SGI71_02535 [Verrucomicrobiota bacterium]|nr:hypothetical protein [Verrucomicrobiota bacterium]